ncbi:hypothetical protein DU490_10285 [Halomonas sp. DQ26W]|nr:hypothetical protein DU490_10285 [Halomonas sp. DQ26W]
MLAVSRQLEISDKRLWCIVYHYVGRMLGELDLSSVATVGVDETASRYAASTTLTGRRRLK